MKRKFIFLIEELNKGNTKPYLIIDEDEERNVPDSITVLEGDIDLDTSKWNGSSFVEDDNSEKEYHFVDSYNDRPPYYVWDKDKYYWKLDLDKYKEYTISQFQSIRESKIEEDIELYGHKFQVRKGDLENFYDVTIGIMENPSMAQESVLWRLSDNTFAQFTYAQIKEVLEERGKRKKIIFAKFGELEQQIKSASTINDVDAIKWE